MTKEEHKFQEVKDKLDQVTHFELHGHNKVIGVNLTKGVFYFLSQINKKLAMATELEENNKINLRLIYFRRNKIEMSEGMKPINHEVNYFIGFQYNDENNKNHKLLAQIDSLGNIIFGGE